MDITNDILNNREKYPDTAEITLVDGTKITVKEFRDQLQPRAEFTRAAETWKREKQQLEQAHSGLQGQLREREQALTTALAEKAALEGRAPKPTPAGGPSEEELLADPVLGGLVKDIRATRAELVETKQQLKEQGEQLKRGSEHLIRRDYETQLGRISSYHNDRFNRDGKGKAFDQAGFIEYVMKRSESNPAFANDLGLAYNEYSRGDEIAHVTREAEERGREAGRKEARVPTIPNGRRSAPARPEGLPADTTLQTLTDEQVLADPDIQAALRGDDTA